MSHNSTCGVLDCSDSPLSITGNVFGIFTLAYAILITFVYRAKDVATAKDEKKNFNERARRAQNSLVDAQERLKALFSMLQVPISQEIEMLLADAESWHLKYRERFFSGKFVDGMPITKETAYLIGKDELNRVFEGMVQTKVTLDGTYHVLLNSIIIDEIRKQKVASEVHSRVASKQIAMLSQVMSALDLEVPADSTEEPDAPAKDGLIAMIDMYLRYSKQTKHGASPPTHRITSEEVISLPPLPTHSRTPMQVTDAPLFDNWQRSDPTTTPGSDNWQPFDRGTYNPDTGTANITIVSASGFPSSANVRVHVLVQGAKGAKRAHKTKAHKASGDSPISYNESFRIPGTTADASYQIRVVDHSAFRSDDTLGVAMFFVSDQGSVADQDKPVPVGEGTVTIRSSFNAPEGSLRPTSLHSTNSDAV